MLPDYKPMSPAQLLILIMAGVSATVGQLNITAAYTYAPAKEISVFDYSQVIFAAVLGFLFFGELPDIWSWIGYVIIIGTAIVSWRRNLGR
jgi:drug/metabolite transporter (DMT)-like permease